MRVELPHERVHIPGPERADGLMSVEERRSIKAFAGGARRIESTRKVISAATQAIRAPETTSIRHTNIARTENQARKAKDERTKDERLDFQVFHGEPGTRPRDTTILRRDDWTPKPARFAGIKASNRTRNDELRSSEFADAPSLIGPAPCPSGPITLRVARDAGERRVASVQTWRSTTVITGRRAGCGARARFRSPLRRRRRTRPAKL